MGNSYQQGRAQQHKEVIRVTLVLVWVINKQDRVPRIKLNRVNDQVRPAKVKINLWRAEPMDGSVMRLSILVITIITNKKVDNTQDYLFSTRSSTTLMNQG